MLAGMPKDKIFHQAPPPERWGHIGLLDIIIRRRMAVRVQPDDHESGYVLPVIQEMPYRVFSLPHAFKPFHERTLSRQISLYLPEFRKVFAVHPGGQLSAVTGPPFLPRCLRRPLMLHFRYPAFSFLSSASASLLQ